MNTITIAILTFTGIVGVGGQAPVQYVTEWHTPHTQVHTYTQPVHNIQYHQESFEETLNREYRTFQLIQRSA